MVEGNSLRDSVKNTIRECLIEAGVDKYEAAEMTYDLADGIFDTLGISVEYQDNSYEEELTQLIGFYEARESIPNLR